jgi:hypothetical protein
LKGGKCNFKGFFSFFFFFFLIFVLLKICMHVCSIKIKGKIHEAIFTLLNQTLNSLPSLPVNSNPPHFTGPLQFMITPAEPLIDIPSGPYLHKAHFYPGTYSLSDIFTQCLAHNFHIISKHQNPAPLSRPTPSFSPEKLTFLVPYKSSQQSCSYSASTRFHITGLNAGAVCLLGPA